MGGGEENSYATSGSSVDMLLVDCCWLGAWIGWLVSWVDAGVGVGGGRGVLKFRKVTGFSNFTDFKKDIPPPHHT